MDLNESLPAEISEIFAQQIAAPATLKPRIGRWLTPISGAILTLLAIGLGGCGKSPEELKVAAAAEAARTTGALLVKSNLPSATIEATSTTVPAGTSPKSFEGTVNQPLTALPAGQYAVIVRSQGWPELYGSAEVSVGTTAEVTMNFKSGSLNLDSVPTGATIKHGGTVLGQTPMLILQLPAGECELALEYPFWPVLNFKTAIAENGETAATARLPHGRLTIDSVPAGAQIRLEGRVLGRTPLVVEQMPAGPKRIILQAENYLQVTVSLTLQDRADATIRPELGSVFPELDTTELLRSVWVPDDPNELAPSFDSVGRYEPKNGIVKNIHRKKVFENWLGKKYRFVAVVKDYDARDGEIEFVEQTNVLSKNRVVAKLSPEARAAGKLNPALVKGAALAIYGQLTAVEEPRWPSKVITLEISQAEVLKAGSTPAF